MILKNKMSTFCLAIKIHLLTALSVSDKRQRNATESIN